MTDNSDDKKQVLLDAKKMIHHIDLLISQCNSWLPARQLNKFIAPALHNF